MPRTSAPVVEEVVVDASYGIKSTAAKAVQAKRESAMNAVASECKGDPAGYGPSAANTQTAAITRYSGCNPMRRSKNKQQATDSAVNAARVMKHLPAAFHDVNGPQGRPKNVMKGGRTLTIATRISCPFPDQKALLSAIDLHR
jgi:hypothetical protein